MGKSDPNPSPTSQRNVLNWKAVMQSAGGASGSPVFNANASVVGALFAGGDTSDPRFAGGPWKTEAVMVAADYVKDALDDGVRALTWPARGATGLELDLVPLSTARAYYGLGKSDLEELRAADAAATPSIASPISGPAAPLRPRDRVIVIAGVEPGAPTAAAAAAAVMPGDVLWAVNGALLGGDMRAFERALHGAVGGKVNVTLVRRGARVAATLPVYDMTADRTVRYAAWAGGVFHDVSDRTRYTYRVSFVAGWVDEREGLTIVFFLLTPLPPPHNHRSPPPSAASSCRTPPPGRRGRTTTSTTPGFRPRAWCLKSTACRRRRSMR